MRKPRRKGRWRIGDCRGGAAVEFALVLPFLLGLIYGTIELGRLFWDVAMLNFAVSDAARCAVIDRAGACNTQANSTAVQQAALGWGGLVIGPPDIQTSSFQVDVQGRNLCPGSNIISVCVCASPTFTTLVQGFLGARRALSFPLNASSCYPSQ
jgi:Flp pilus assembly protein TadG